MKTICVEKKIKLDKTSLVLTPVCLIGMLWFFFVFKEPKMHHLLIYYVLFYVAMLISGLYFWPRSVVLTNKFLVVKRIFSSKKIRMTDIKTVVPSSAFDFRKTIRTCGSGAYFGYWGWFYNPQIGKFQAYVGKWNESFFIELNNGKKYVVSCEDSSEIVEMIKASIGK